MGELFFTAEYQLINVDGMMRLECHHCATIIVIIDVDKNYQWMPKLGSLRKNMLVT